MAEQDLQRTCLGDHVERHVGLATQQVGVYVSGGSGSDSQGWELWGCMSVAVGGGRGACDKCHWSN